MPEDHFAGEVAARYDERLAAMGSPEVLEPTVDLLSNLAGTGAALELAVGTGRIALPLAARGVPVSGIELSPDMVAQLRAKPGGDAIPVTIGDMTTARVEGAFRLVYLLYNTIGNVETQDRQVACFENAARHLEPGGSFVVEMVVPDLRRLVPGHDAIVFAHAPRYVGYDRYDDLVAPAPKPCSITSRKTDTRSDTGPPAGSAAVRFSSSAANLDSIDAVSGEVKGVYQSEVRQAAAAANRAAVREAATTLFVEHGYAATTVREIARAAGVSVRTVFNGYPNGKAQIFDEALDLALGGDDSRIPLADRPVTRDVFIGSDPADVIERLADGALEIYERSGGLITTYMESSGADPHMRRHAELGEAEAGVIMARVARQLAAQGALRPNLSTQRASQMLLALCSPTLHHLLRRRSGWSAASYRRWLVRQLAAAVLREPNGVP